MTPQPAQEPVFEQDARFPSGPWKGFFIQRIFPGRNWMELHLTFQKGQIRGDGRDRVGEFLIRGSYDLDTGKCWWSKRYLGKHDVAYEGYNEGKGIWGLWNIKLPPLRGGFHIWPVAMGDPTQLKLAEALEIPIEAVESAPVEAEEVYAGAV